jgi:protein-disulfide isomerase
MTLPLSDSALIGTCLAASALGLLVLTGGGGNGAPDADTVATAQVEDAPAPEPEAQATSDAPADVDEEFGDQVRAYLLDNPEVIFEAVAVYEERNMAAQTDMSRELIAANADAIFDDGFSWVGGNPDGDITLVEFVDYRCGFCQRAHDEVFGFVEADGNTRLIIKEFPILGPESEMAARYAIAVLNEKGDDAYEQVHGALLGHDAPITDEALSDLSADLGLDHDAIAAAMDSDATTEVIAANRNLAQRLQITGTPTFVMEDEMIRGFVEADVLANVAADLRD